MITKQLIDFGETPNLTETHFRAGKNWVSCHRHPGKTLD